MVKNIYSDYRCTCGKLLSKALLLDGAVEIKCRRCGRMNHYGEINGLSEPLKFILTVDSEGTIVSCSEGTCALLGYNCTELQNKSVLKVHPDIPKETYAKYCKLQTLENFSYYIKLDTFLQTKLGESKNCSVVFKLCRRDHMEGRQLVMFGHIKPDESTPSSKKLETQSCAYYFDIDQFGNIRYISPETTKIFGVAQTNVPDINYFDLFSSTPQKLREIFDLHATDEKSFKLLGNEEIKPINKNIATQTIVTPKYSDIGNFNGFTITGWNDK